MPPCADEVKLDLHESRQSKLKLEPGPSRLELETTPLLVASPFCAFLQPIDPSSFRISCHRMSVHSLQAGLQACKLCTVTRVSQASRRLQGVSSRLSSTHAAPVASRYPYHARSFSSSSSSFRVQRTKPPPTSKVFRGRETRDKPSYDGTFEGLFSKKRARGSYRKGNGAAQAAASAFNLSSEVPEALGSVEPTREEVFAALQRRIEELRDGSATKSSRGPTGPGMASILKAVATSLGISPAALLRLAQEWVASDPLAAATRSLKGKGKQAKENDKG